MQPRIILAGEIEREAMRCALAAYSETLWHAVHHGDDVNPEMLLAVEEMRLELGHPGILENNRKCRSWAEHLLREATTPIEVMA